MEWWRLNQTFDGSHQIGGATSAGRTDELVAVRCWILSRPLSEGRNVDQNEPPFPYGRRATPMTSA
jgi:hypothetical protein